MFKTICCNDSFEQFEYQMFGYDVQNWTILELFITGEMEQLEYKKKCILIPTLNRSSLCKIN